MRDELEAAVSSSTIRLARTGLTPLDISRAVRSNQIGVSAVSIAVPDAELHALAVKLSEHTHPFTNPDTKEVGFTPVNHLGLSGANERFTDTVLAKSLVRAAALSSPDAIVATFLNWIHGKPAHFYFTRVLRGVRLSDPVDLEDGARFETLPNNTRMWKRTSPINHFMQTLWSWLANHASVPGSRYDRLLQPETTKYPYRLDDTRVIERNVTTHDTAIDTSEYHQLLTSLSLVCNSHVHQTHSWHELPLDLRLVTGSSSLPTTSNVPKFDYHLQGSPFKLTSENIGQVKTVRSNYPGAMTCACRSTDGRTV